MTASYITTSEAGTEVRSHTASRLSCGGSDTARQVCSSTSRFHGAIGRPAASRLKSRNRRTEVSVTSRWMNPAAPAQLWRWERALKRTVRPVACGITSRAPESLCISGSSSW